MAPVRALGWVRASWAACRVRQKVRLETGLRARWRRFRTSRYATRRCCHIVAAVCDAVLALMASRVLCQDEILYMGFDATKIGLPADFVLTDYSKVSRTSALPRRRGGCQWTER